MSPLEVFVRTLLKTSAIFIGVTAVFLNPSFDWSAARTAVTAQNSPREMAVDALVGALRDSDAGVRRQAAIALGQVGDRRAVPDLIEALRDENADIRRRAATALGEIGDQRALAALTGAMKDTDAAVRRSAIMAIAGIGGER